MGIREAKALTHNNPLRVDLHDVVDLVRLDDVQMGGLAWFRDTTDGFVAAAEELRKAIPARATIEKIAHFYRDRFVTEADRLIEHLERYVGVNFKIALDLNDYDTMKKVIGGLTRAEYGPVTELRLMTEFYPAAPAKVEAKPDAVQRRSKRG